MDAAFSVHLSSLLVRVSLKLPSLRLHDRLFRFAVLSADLLLNQVREEESNVCSETRVEQHVHILFPTKNGGLRAVTIGVYLSPDHRPSLRTRPHECQRPPPSAGHRILSPAPIPTCDIGVLHCIITFVYLLVCPVPCVHTSWPSFRSQSLKLSPLSQPWQGFCQHARQPPECHRGA